MMDETEVVIDDEKDTLNDETFGDCGEEYTWDGAEQSDDFFGIGQNMPEIDKKNSNLLNQFETEVAVPPLYSGIEGSLYGAYDDQDSGYTNVEESISRLVLEDDDIENERDRIIKASHRSLMPPQVITRNLNWFTEQDTKSSFFSSSIWSMHPTDVLQGTLDAQQSQQQQPATTIIPPQPSYRPPPGLAEKPGFRTLEEIENEQHLTAAKSGFQVSNVSAASGIPHAHSFLPPISNAHAVSRTNLQEIRGMQLPPPTSQMQSGTGSGIMRPPPGIQHNNMNFPLMSNRPLLFQHTGPSRIHPENVRDFPGIAPKSHASAQQRSSYGSDSGDSLNHGMPEQRGRTMLPTMDRPQQNSRFRVNLEFMGKRPHGYGHPSRNFHRGENWSGDRYSGLMTEQDKQRLRNIQILQLQSDHPYTTDYYYQVRAFNKDGDIRHLRKVFPSKEERPRKKKYQPTRFDNALGKLQTVSALAPKRVMDTVLKVAAMSTNPQNSRSLLWREIERHYKLYLNCMELSYRRIADTLHDKDNPMPEFAAYSKVLQAFDKLGDRGIFFRWMLYQKGRELVLSFARQFTAYERGHSAAYMFLAIFIKSSTLPSMHRMEKSPTFMEECNLIAHMIDRADFYLIDLLLQACHDVLWRSCFGCTVGLMILNAAAPFAYSGTIPLDWEPVYTTHPGTDFSAPLRISTSDDYIPGFLRFPTLLKGLMKIPLNELGIPLARAFVTEGGLLPFAPRGGESFSPDIDLTLRHMLSVLENHRKYIDQSAK